MGCVGGNTEWRGIVLQPKKKHTMLLYQVYVQLLIRGRLHSSQLRQNMTAWWHLMISSTGWGKWHSLEKFLEPLDGWCQQQDRCLWGCGTIFFSLIMNEWLSVNLSQVKTLVKHWDVWIELFYMFYFSQIFLFYLISFYFAFFVGLVVRMNVWWN